MSQDIRFYRRRIRITCVLGMILVVGSQAYADVLGRVHFVVKNAADEKVLADAKVVLTDSAGIKPPITLTTDKDGNATTGQIDARAWHVVTTSEEYTADTRDVTVVADTTTDVEVLLEPLKEKVIKVTGNRNVTRPTETGTASKRDQTFIQKFPTQPGNKQSLSAVLRTNPGFAQDSVGQLHPRGEHASTTIYLNGFQIPGAFQGRAGQILSPTAIQNVDVLTGGYAPEYGRETAAILNVSLRSGTLIPFGAYSASGGTFSTYEGGFTAGGQTGKEYGAADADGRHARQFGYLFDFDGRTTQNSLEPPQPDQQTAHNDGRSFTTFGNLDFHINDKDSLSLTLSANPARTNVANRTGLPDFFAPYGQGYGYGGAQGPGSGLATQQQLGQDVYQKDNNAFAVLNYLKAIDVNTEARLSFGLVYNGLDILNNSPSINLASLPADSSIEFNPTLTRHSRDAQFQGSITRSQDKHTFKAGFTYDKQSGFESYQLIPGSQAALNVLLSGDPNNSTPDPTNPLYALRPDGTTPSTVNVKRSGHYAAAYVQDTWRISSKLTANYGFRFDDYVGNQDTQRNVETPDSAQSSLKMVSPRLNLAYVVSPKTVVRASYNRLMITPPSAQGAGIGIVVEPERLNQYEVSVEHQTGAGQSLKVAGYYKDIVNQLDTGLLVPGTQIGAFVTDNIPRDKVKAIEVSYNLFPTQPYGLDAYVSYANALAKVQGVDDTYNDHDQLNTVSMGMNYKFRTGDQVGATFNYGSGFASSQLTDPGPRKAHSETNLRFASRPNLIGYASVSLEVQNLFDNRDFINFNSAFSGTRFQQGRRLILSINGKL